MDKELDRIIRGLPMPEVNTRRGYRGPERRKGHRRQGNLRGSVTNITESTAHGQTLSTGGGAHGIVEIKEDIAQPEKRYLGAGRRKGDFERALGSIRGETIFDMSRTPKETFKTGIAPRHLKKIAKKAGPLGVAVSAVGLAEEAKNWFKK